MQRVGERKSSKIRREEGTRREDESTEKGEEREHVEERKGQRESRERVRSLCAGRVEGLNKMERGAFVLVDARRGGR